MRPTSSKCLELSWKKLRSTCLISAAQKELPEVAGKVIMDQFERHLESVAL